MLTITPDETKTRSGIATLTLQVNASPEDNQLPKSKTIGKANVSKF